MDFTDDLKRKPDEAKNETVAKKSVSGVGVKLEDADLDNVAGGLSIPEPRPHDDRRPIA